MNVAQITVNVHDFNDKLVPIPMFQLLQFKHAMELEAKGVKIAHKSVTAHVRKLLSTPKGYSRDWLIQHITESIEEVNERLGVTQ